MKYLLDTCVVSDFVRCKGGVQNQLKRCGPSDVFLSSITLFEIYYGLERNPETALKIKPMLQAFIGAVTTLPFTADIAQHAGNLRAYLRQLGTPIGSYDILIAATALAHDLVLVTSNTDEFSRVPGIQLENWR
jgi:tRNA(fMet)-specific endonuclease VapC